MVVWYVVFTRRFVPSFYLSNAAHLYSFWWTKYLLVARSFSFLSDLAKRGIVLPKVSKPVGNYVSILRTGNMLYLCIIGTFSSDVVAGALPMKEDGSFYKGKVCEEIRNELWRLELISTRKLDTMLQEGREWCWQRTFCVIIVIRVDNSWDLGPDQSSCLQSRYPRFFLPIDNWICECMSYVWESTCGCERRFRCFSRDFRWEWQAHIHFLKDSVS